MIFLKYYVIDIRNMHLKINDFNFLIYIKFHICSCREQIRWVRHECHFTM